MYQFKTEEIELNEEEKEKAKFIVDICKEKKKEKVKGISESVWGAIESAAFENFKIALYSAICLRLQLDVYANQGSMAVTADGTKVIVVTVDKPKQ